MTIEKTHIEGCVVITPRIISDDRGYFFESFNKISFERETGLSIDFVQDNQSKSNKGVLRGLHFQTGDFQQAKLVRVVKGSVLDVCVDLRPSSPTYKEHVAIVLDDKENKQLLIPRGFAHGFLVLEDNTIFNYKCDQYYHKPSEAGIIYNDPTFNINWNFPIDQLILSDKDKKLPTFEQFVKA